MARKRAAASDPLPSINTKVKRGKVATETTNTSQTRGKRKTPQYRRLENGLLDVGHVPEHLLDMVQRNATDSPLLRLPGELRNKIWEYVLTGLRIQFEVTSRRLRSTEHCFLKARVAKNEWQDRSTTLSAFKLSRVCRQIYSDTAQLVYSYTLFTFPRRRGDDHRAWKQWASKVMLGQLNSIETVEVGENVAYTHRLKQTLPAIKKITVVLINRPWWERWGTKPRQFIIDEARIKQGDGVDVIFRTVSFGSTRLLPVI